MSKMWSLTETLAHDLQTAWLQRLDKQFIYDRWMSIAAALVIVLVIHRFLWVYSQDLREPELIKPRFPIIGHVISIYMHGSRHFVRIAKKTGLPIYQMPVPGGKIAIAHTPEVLAAIDKNPKAIAFVPLASEIIKKLSGLSPQGAKGLCDRTVGEDRMEGYMYQLSKGVHATLAPGQSLRAVTDVVSYDLNGSIRKLQGKTTRMNLLPWFRHEFGLSSTNGIYGPLNPFKDPKVENGFWAFDDSISDLLISPKPRLTCRFGDQGRTDAWAGFDKYFTQKGHEQGSALVKVRYEAAVDKGMSNLDIAKLEVTMIIGILTNTVPTIFWAVYYAYSDPSLLQELRKEISTVAVQSKDEKTGKRVWTLRSSDLKDKCRFLTAMINETFRHRACGISSRLVTEDVVLNNRYLLKQGTVCELPNNVLHSNAAYWGPSVDEFDPTRFLADASSKEARMARGAFRPFGGGVSMCAGRHQAMSQLLGGLALFVMSSDCEPADGKPWKFPGAHGHTIAAAVDLPSSDMWLDVKPRSGFETDSWEIDPKN